MSVNKADVNEITIDGITYEAAPEGRYEGCGGCEGLNDDALCSKLPFCTSAIRSDGRNIIWIKVGE